MKTFIVFVCALALAAAATDKDNRDKRSFGHYYDTPAVYTAPVSTYTAPVVSNAQYAVRVPVSYSYPVHHAVQPAYRTLAPVTAYQAPVTAYQAPVTAYHAPVTAYQAPITTYHAPVHAYQAPLTYPAPVNTLYKTWDPVTSTWC